MSQASSLQSATKHKTRQGDSHSWGSGRASSAGFSSMAITAGSKDSSSLQDPVCCGFPRGPNEELAHQQGFAIDLASPAYLYTFTENAWVAMLLTLITSRHCGLVSFRPVFLCAFKFSISLQELLHQRSISSWAGSISKLHSWLLRCKRQIFATRSPTAWKVEDWLVLASVMDTRIQTRLRTAARGAHALHAHPPAWDPQVPTLLRNSSLKPARKSSRQSSCGGFAVEPGDPLRPQS